MLQLDWGFVFLRVFSMKKGRYKTCPYIKTRATTESCPYKKNG
jgi:hypothetical protein